MIKVPDSVHVATVVLSRVLSRSRRPSFNYEEIISSHVWCLLLFCLKFSINPDPSLHIGSSVQVVAAISSRVLNRSGLPMTPFGFICSGCYCRLVASSEPVRTSHGSISIYLSRLLLPSYGKFWTDQDFPWLHLDSSVQVVTAVLWRVLNRSGQKGCVHWRTATHHPIHELFAKVLADSVLLLLLLLLLFFQWKGERRCCWVFMFRRSLRTGELTS